MMSQKPRTLLAADWGKSSHKRVVYQADVAERTIQRADGTEWTLERLLATARDKVRSGKGPVLISLDLVLGVPDRYFQQVQDVPEWARAHSFLDWLARLETEKDFWQEVKKGDDWSIQRPFCSVPKGTGALKAFSAKAGYELRRRVDVQCRSKSPFVVSGIPGSVGSGTRCLWRELAPLVYGERDFKIWPFEGRMCQLLGDHDIVLTENYPGICYTSVLAQQLPSPQILVGKGKPGCRIAALSQLEKASWVRQCSVQLPDLEAARNSEDDFDALMTAAAELRCLLEGRSLENPNLDDPVAEGGILLTSEIDFSRKANKLQCGEVASSQSGPVTNRPHKPVSSNKAESKQREYPCPIPGCGKVFVQTRSGWDGHIGSLPIHPNWHPEVHDRHDRRDLFRQEFPDFWA